MRIILVVGSRIVTIAREPSDTLMTSGSFTKLPVFWFGDHIGQVFWNLGFLGQLEFKASQFSSLFRPPADDCRH